MADLCKDNEYNSECWVRRSDYNPPKDTKIEEYVGGRASWHPGHRVHQLIGRKWSLIVLYALEAALDTWNVGMQEKGLPLANEYWHVGTEVADTQYKIPPTYEEIRQKLRSYVPDNDEEVSKCEKLLHNFPIVCKVAMHGYTEWTPRALPEERSLRAILKSGPSGYLPVLSKVNAYDGFDILPAKWQIPGGEIDVHAIAIATALPPTDDNSDPARSMDYQADPSSAFETQKRESEIDEQRLLRVNLPSAKSENHNVDISEEQQTAMRRLGEKLVHFGMEGHHLVPLRLAQQNRILLTDEESQEIIPGEGWLYSGSRCGFCDGSFQSECQRSVDSTCPMKGHSDGRSGLLGDALSGWLVFEVPNVKEGIIILRLEVWKDPNSNTRTEGWTKVDNGDTSTEDEMLENITELADNANAEGRRLFIPENDFYFDYAINGDIKTMDYDEFISYKEKVGKNMSLWPVMLPSKKKEQVPKNNNGKKGETVEVAIRLRSTAGREATVAVSHLYYA